MVFFRERKNKELLSSRIPAGSVFSSVRESWPTRGREKSRRNRRLSSLIKERCKRSSGLYGRENESTRKFRQAVGVCESIAHSGNSSMQLIKFRMHVRVSRTRLVETRGKLRSWFNATFVFPPRLGTMRVRPISSHPFRSFRRSV